MAYISSDKIHVFPIAKSRSNQRAANLMYEDNISNIIRQLTDYPGFIITRNPDVTFNNGILTFNKDFEFNLWGHYFRIEKDVTVNLGGSLVTDIYASIITDTDTGEISNQDVNGEYQGLKITSSNEGSHYLCLFNTLDSNTVEVCEESLFKFNNSSVNIKRIDGKRAL